LPRVYFFSLIGNILPVIPLLYFFRYFFNTLKNMRIVGSFFVWWFKSVEKRSKIVERWGFWGLVVFVAIPLPVTGAWTGTIAATLFDIKIKRALLAIIIGVAVAGIIVSILSITVPAVIRHWLTPLLP
jgi:uncharacterized membrane protein